MAKTLKVTLQNIQTMIKALTALKLPDVTIGEPKAPPESKHVAIMLRRYTNPSTTLTGTVELRTVGCRAYINMVREPIEEIEFDLDEIAVSIIEKFCGDYDIGAQVRGIDPTLITVEFGYQTIGQTLFRIADVLVPLIVDDSASFTQ